MSKYTWHLGASLALGASVLLGACKSEPKQGPDSALKTDSALNRDLSLAGQDTTAQPQLKDVPAGQPAGTAAPAAAATRAPARTSTRPSTRPSTTPSTRTSSGNTVTRSGAGAASTGGGAVGMIPAGSELSLRSNSKVCTNTNQVGDHITATVNNSVSGSNGAVIPAGATVNMTVTRLKRSENVNDPVVMEFAVNSVSFGGHTYPVEASITSAAVNRIKDQPKNKDIQKVATGAVIGAIAGKILGKSTKGAVIGGAAGAAAGAATAAATANYQGCIDEGGSMTVKLNSSVQVKA